MSYSEHGEDTWAVAQFPPGFVGWAAEVGAHDGVTLSNTKLLEDAGWTVLCIEPNPGVTLNLKEQRKTVWVGACSDRNDAAPFYVYRPEPTWSSLHRTLVYRSEPTCSSLDRGMLPTSGGQNPPDAWDEIVVPVHKLGYLLLKYGFPQLDLLSVDTEGTELDVLKGIDLERWKPRAIICESWATENPIVDYLAAREYERVGRLNVNDLFIRKAT